MVSETVETVTQKLAKALRSEVENGGVGSLTVQKDLTMVLKRNYFYRHGNTAEGFAEKVRREASTLLVGLDADAKFRVVIDKAEIEEHPWPKRSFFKATLSVRAN